VKGVLIAAVACCLCVSGADTKKPDVQVMDIKAQRDGAFTVIDGRLRATGPKPIAHLVLAFDFMAPGRVTIASKKVEIDENMLDPGAESAFHAETECPAKAVEYMVRALKNGQSELNVANAGPHPILD
jgi:hypothetical protein